MSSISYTLRKADLIEFNDYHARMNTGYGTSMSRHQMLWPALVVLAALFIVISTGDVEKGVLLLVGAFIWSLAVPALIRKKFHQHILEQLPEADIAKAIGDYTLTVTPDGLLEKNSQTEKLTKWADIKRVETSKHHLYFYLSEAAAIIIPKEMVSEQDDFKTFYNAAIESIKQATKSIA